MESRHTVFSTLTVSVAFLIIAGDYLYIEADGQRSGNVAVLVFPEVTVQPNEEMCFSFGYHMYGSDMGRLKVVREDATEQAPIDLFDVSGRYPKMRHTCLVCFVFVFAVSTWILRFN